MKNKTFARISSIQSLYQFIICENTSTPEEVIDNIIKYNKEDITKPDKYFELNIKFSSEIFHLTVNNLDKIDTIIESNLNTNWTIASIHLTLLCLIRVAVAELLFYPETPIKVIISEYTTISTSILSEGEENFVNAILENIARIVRVNKNAL